MSVSVTTTRPCLVCGAPVEHVEILAEVTSGCIVNPRRVVWCSQCGEEQPGESDG